ncbi:MAG TPA: ABC transporter permease subunit [Ignavibacteria bacterium]|nr:ABC transporter permease subunit [Ignavibacteria bacterium]
MKSLIYKAFIKKDLKTVFGDKIIYLPFIILPVIFCVILPAGFIIASNFMSDASVNDNFKEIPLPEEFQSLNLREKFLYLSLNTIFPSLFLLIPIMSASIIAGTGFVGEKENKTIESILYTPVSVSEIFKAKVLSALIPSILFTFVSFIIFFIILFIGKALSSVEIIIPVVKWFTLVFWLSPALALLAVLFMVLVSAKAKTFQQAQQRIVYIILPLIIIGIGQISGIFILNSLVLFIAGILIFTCNYFLFKFCEQSFVPEKLIT